MSPFPATTATEARLWTQNRELSRRIGEVVALHFKHTPETAAIVGDTTLVGKCRVCRVPHPCPTVDTLTSEPRAQSYSIGLTPPPDRTTIFNPVTRRWENP